MDEDAKDSVLRLVHVCKVAQLIKTEPSLQSDCKWHLLLLSDASMVQYSRGFYLRDTTTGEKRQTVQEAIYEHLSTELQYEMKYQ